MIRRLVVVALLASSCGKSAPAPAPAPAKADATHIPITVTMSGFEPSKVTVQRGVATTLIFTRTSDDTCAKQVVIHVSPTEKIEKQLPLNERVEVTMTFPNSGEVKYACGMDMITGVITVP